MHARFLEIEITGSCPYRCKHCYGGFPRPGRARIAWLGFAPEPALDALEARLWAALRAGGAAFDDKPFQAHLTLARYREPVDLGRLDLPVMETLTFETGGVGLFQSVPGPQGSSYRLLGAADCK